MSLLIRAFPFQTTTPTPAAGPEQLVEYGPVLVRGLWFLVGVSVVILIGWYVLTPLLSRTVRRRNYNNPTLQEAMTRFFRVGIVLAAIIVGAGLAGYSQFVTSSALVVAAVTIALGVAGQTVIGSLISGLVLVFDPEFNVGDYIEWDGGNGRVESITLRVTRVQTPGGELLTVPNTVLTDQTIGRPYGRNRYRIVERIGLAYDDDIEEAMIHIERAAEQLDGIRTEPQPTAYVDDLASDEVSVRLRYWVTNPDERNVVAIRSKCITAIKARLEAESITISPATQRDLQGRITIDNPTGET